MRWLRGPPRLLIRVRARKRWRRLAALHIVDYGFLLKDERSSLIYIVFPVEQADPKTETINLHVLAIAIVLVTTVLVSEISGSGHSDIAHVYPRRSGK